MNKFGTLTMGEAIKIVSDYDSMSKEIFESTVVHKWENGEIDDVEKLSEYDLTFRNEIKKVFDSFFPETGGNRHRMYPLDLHIGLKVFELLYPGKDGFTISDASDDDMWRYISVKVIPDMTYLRYPPKSEKGAKNINKKRFYSETRRIWIKTLWWYVYLSWQGDAESTCDVLKSNSVDNINKLIETPGKGYRLSLYRTIMAEYATRNHKPKYFAGVTKLNNAKCKTIEPSLLIGGEKGYAAELFDEVPYMVEQEDDDDSEE